MSSTVEIKAVDVQKLRQTTGAGLMDCKRALSDAGGDMEKAIKLLRERGIAKSSKRADRVAGEGLVVLKVSDNGKEGALFELNCETDFVARNEDFQALAQKLAGDVLSTPDWTAADQIPEEPILALSAKVGEKMQARRFARYQADKGLVSGYIHAGSKLGVLIHLEAEKDIAASDAVKELARELTLQIAGAAPSYVESKEIPADVIEREKEIAKKQMEGQKKPPEILEKIAVGKLQQFYATHCLLDQPHVRDGSGKTKVSDVIKQASEKEGTAVRVIAFARFRVGAD